MTGTGLAVLAGSWLAVASGVPAAQAGSPVRTPVTLSITETVDRYPVHGASLDALRGALADEAAAGRAGGSHGRTLSNLALEYAPREVPGGCEARGVAIRLGITTTLPEWVPGVDAERGLAARWDAVAQALARHESRHRDHALAAARDLQSSLSGLGTLPDCGALRTAIDRALMRVRLRAEFRDARYDEITRNGLADGTRL